MSSNYPEVTGPEFVIEVSDFFEVDHIEYRGADGSEYRLYVLAVQPEDEIHNPFYAALMEEYVEEDQPYVQIGVVKDGKEEIIGEGILYDEAAEETGIRIGTTPWVCLPHESGEYDLAKYQLSAPMDFIRVFRLVELEEHEIY